MRKKGAEKGKNQGTTTPEMSMVLQQLTLPLLMAVEATKKGLYAFIQQMGMLALHELLAAEAERIAGPKGRHAKDRAYHHWGSTTTTLPFGGRHVRVERPRVRAKGNGGKEVELPSLEVLREADPMSERVLEQIAIGVSTRGYDRSLEDVEDEIVETRATSKSNVSRSLIDGTKEKLAEFLNRKLDDLNFDSHIHRWDRSREARRRDCARSHERWHKRTAWRVGGCHGERGTCDGPTTESCRAWNAN